MGYDLYALQCAGRERLEVLLQPLGLEVRRLVVYPDGDLCPTPIADITFGVHLHARGILKGIGGVAALHAGVVAHIVVHLFAVGRVERPAGGDLHGFEQRGIVGNLDNAKICVVIYHNILPPGLVPHSS